MPRWVLLLLLGMVGVLCWTGYRGAAPKAAVSLAGDSMTTCPRAPAFTHVDNPRQTAVDGKISPFRLGDATISPLAGFSLQARVLSREDYSLDAESDFSPTDLALGWGPMSAPGMAERLRISQASRFYYYRWGREGPPMAPDEIVRNSANIHMVPADSTVAHALSRVGAGDLVRINGWLIRINRDNGWYWQSSLSREDTGSGSCEVVFVCSIETR